MRPREDGGQTEAEVDGHEEGGDDGGPVMRLGEPVQLAQTTAENEPHRHAAEYRRFFRLCRFFSGCLGALLSSTGRHFS